MSFFFKCLLSFLFRFAYRHGLESRQDGPASVAQPLDQRCDPPSQSTEPQPPDAPGGVVRAAPHEQEGHEGGGGEGRAPALRAEVPPTPSTPTTIGQEGQV